MQTQTMQRTDLAQAARKSLKDAIISGELKPGSPLRAEELTRMLDVSASPIREALRLLERDGLVEIVPYRGAFVRVFDQTEFAEVYEIREFLERGALQKAMPNVLAEVLSRLTQACRDLQAALDDGNHTGFLDADVRFHQAIIDMAGNRQMCNTFQSLVEQGLCFMLGRDLKDFRGARREHVELLKAIRTGNTVETLRLHHEHFQSTVRGLTGPKRIRVEKTRP